MYANLYERILEYPRLSAAVAISMVVHLIVIFYMPPNWVTLMFTNNTQGTEEERQPQSININLRGDLANAAEGKQGEKDSNEGKDKGQFAGLDQNKWGALLERLEKNTGLQEGYKQVYEDLHSNGQISDSYIYRDRQHEDIVVKEVFPTIHDIDKPFKDILAASPQTLSDYVERNEIIEQYRQWDKGEQTNQELKISLSTETGKTKKGPLHFPKPARSDYFDNTLTQGKESQLANFIRQYFAHDPNEGDLPIATRELYYDNLQRLAYSFSSDPSFLYLDYYLENLNKEDFLNNAIYQAAQLDGSKTQTELLFAIQDIYHIQQRAWNYYFNFEQNYQDLSAEKKTRLRNETLKRVSERYKTVLQEKEIADYNDITERYTKKRLEIMDYIIDKTPDGYRRDDARFERAAIHWQYGQDKNDESRRELAIEQWLGLLPQQASDPAQLAATQDSPNLTQTVLLEMAPYLKTYQQIPPPQRRAMQNKLQQLLLSRHQKRLTEKREREERILWPQTPAKKN